MACDSLACNPARGARYRALGGRPRTTAEAFPYTLALCLSLISAALLLGFGRVSCAPPLGCRLWSCTRPLAVSADDRWPAPRDNLAPDVAKRWLALHREQVRSATSVEVARSQLAFLGDSITEGWVRTGFSPRAQSLPQPACERIWRQTFGRYARPLSTPSACPPITATLASAP